MSNTDVLTSGKERYKQKREKKLKGLKELVFDPSERRAFLTGFHQRKLARQKAAQTKAEAKARDEHLRLKRQLRESRKKELQELVKAAGTYITDHLEQDSSNDDAEEKLPGGNVWEQNFDDEVVTNVTITENFQEADDEFKLPKTESGETHIEGKNALPTRKQIQKKMKQVGAKSEKSKPKKKRQKGQRPRTRS